MAPKTRIHLVENGDSDPGIVEASALLAAGQLVAFPTETVYGLGGHALDTEAVAAIFKAKQRPSDNPLIVHVADVAQISSLASSIPMELQSLAQAFWPGPLTLILPAREELLDTVCRGVDTVAVRIPNHPMALALLRHCGLPIAAPSANRSGRPSPTTAAHVLADLDGQLPLILDGGPCQFGLESTVLDISDSQPVLLRPGSISKERISDVLGTEVLIGSDGRVQRRSPGTRYRHYAPDAPLWVLNDTVSQAAFEGIITGFDQGRIGYIGRRMGPERAGDHLLPEVMEQDGQHLASQFYAWLRRFNDEKVSLILMDDPSTFASAALMDRLLRAATVMVENDELLALLWDAHSQGLSKP